MRVARNTVVTLEYVLRAEDGEPIDDTSDGPVRYVHGGEGLVAGLQTALEGRRPGERFEALLPPERAYGRHDPGLLARVPRASFGPATELPTGAMAVLELAEGPRVVTILGEEGGEVLVDANHPLAGRTLRFELFVRAVRAASWREIRADLPLPARER